MTEYRVNLEIYNGPLDLLLYLIRRDEVEIYDINISHITEQYMQYLDILHQLDPNLAGDFLVMAATLMEIKSRMLLPGPESLEGGEDELSIDPRADLVRQLLQYKAFKDAAGELSHAAEMQSLRYPRRPATPEIEGEKEMDLEDAQIWDLFDAFRSVMSSIGATTRKHEVIYDDTPLELHQADLLDRLQRYGKMTFRQVFEGITRRTEVVGLFLAMLELCRLRQVIVMQELGFGEIYLEHVDPDNIEAHRPRNMVTTDTGGIGFEEDGESVWNVADADVQQELSDDDDDKYDDNLDDIKVEFDIDGKLTDGTDDNDGN